MPIQNSRSILFFILMLFLLGACRESSNSRISITRTLTPRNFASGSALVRLGDSVLIAGDDAPFLLMHALANGGARRIAVSGADTTRLRLAKKTKPDWEGGTEVVLEDERQVLFFGSGSISPWRDSLLIIRENWQQRKIPLTKLYDQFRRLRPGQPINIEGAATMGTDLLLFDRSANRIFRLPLVQLEAFIAGGGRQEVSGWRTEALTLPQYGGQQATVSGACMLDAHTILLSASMEVGATAVADGRVLGSYLAFLRWKGREPMLDTLLLRTVKGTILPDKIESVELIGREKDGRLRVLALVDNDDGQSRMHELLLQLPK